MNISKIEVFFDNLLRSTDKVDKLSKNIFYTHLPAAMDRSWKEMILVDIENVEDLGVGMGLINVFIYVKARGDGRKNVTELNKVSSRLNELIASNSDVHYHISRARTYSDYDDARKMDCDVVSLKIMIV